MRVKRSLGSLFCTRVSGSAWKLQVEDPTTMSLHRLAEPGCARATVNPGRWDGVPAQERRWCYPVGEGRHGPRPPWLKSRPQARSEGRGHTRYRESAAGRSQGAGSVGSPAIGHVVVRTERKPTAGPRGQAGVRDARRRAGRRPPGAETRAGSPRGSRETWESPGLPCRKSGVGVPTGAVKTPGAGRRLAPPRRALQEQGTQSQTSATRYRGRRGRTERPRDGPLAV